MRSRVLLLALSACTLASPAATAYNEALHAFLTSRAFPARGEWLAQPLEPPTQADLDAFRALFWRTASTLEDPSLRARFLAAYPTGASFDAWAFKQLLMLDPAATVHGIDVTPSESGPLPRGQLLALASRWPDDDERNRHRYQRDASHAVLKDARGEPLPYDPATLEMGSLSGTSSQGHAHYGLLPPPLSDDPEVLKKDPRHFAIPKTAHTWGAEFAQLYTDLALLAAASGLHGSDWLAATFAGAAFHHLEDVANQIHTVQVGIYDFFEAAYLQSKLHDLTSAGGLLGRRYTLQQLGLRIVSNHHLLSEDLFARRVTEAAAGKADRAEVAAAIHGITVGDPQFEAAARAAEEHGAAFGEAIARAMIEASSTEGPEVYRLAWQFSAKALRDGAGYEYDGANGDDPDAFLAPESAARRAVLAQFYALEGRGLKRAGSALRLWQDRFDRVSAQEPGQLRAAAVGRALALLVPYGEQARARRSGYVPPPPERNTVDWRWPAGELAALLLLALGLRALARRMRRRKS